MPAKGVALRVQECQVQLVELARFDLGAAGLLGGGHPDRFNLGGLVAARDQSVVSELGLGLLEGKDELRVTPLGEE